MSSDTVITSIDTAASYITSIIVRIHLITDYKYIANLFTLKIQINDSLFTSQQTMTNVKIDNEKKVKVYNIIKVLKAEKS